MLQENIKNVFESLKNGNNKNENITLVAATKTVSYDIINKATELGIRDIGENKVNEFRDKYDFIKGARWHFIGHLQTNKVKYLIGKTFLIHSADRLELCEEISKRSQKASLTTDILIQINIGKEDTKSGFYIENAENVYNQIKQMPNIKVKGFMAMLPISENKEYLKKLCLQMRQLYDKIKSTDDNICYLSMGMSGDYKLAIQNGSNMVRIGSGIFGKRNYNI